MGVATKIPCCCDRCKAPWCVHAYGTLDGSFAVGAVSWTGDGIILNKRSLGIGDVHVSSIPGSVLPAGFVNNGHAENPATVPAFGLQMVCEQSETPPEGYTEMRAYLQVALYPESINARVWLTNDQINGIEPIEFDASSVWSGTVSSLSLSIQLEPSRICDGLGCCCTGCTSVNLSVSAASATLSASWTAVLRGIADPLVDPFFTTPAFATMVYRSAVVTGGSWAKMGDDIYSFGYDGYGRIHMGHYQVVTGTGIPVLRLLDEVVSKPNTIDDCPQNLVASNFTGTLGASGSSETATSVSFTISCASQPSCSCPANLVITDTTNDSYLDGPYVDLEPGEYCIRYVSGATLTNAEVDVAAGKGYMTAITLRSTVANFPNGTKQLILRPFPGVKSTLSEAQTASAGYKYFVRFTAATRVYGIVRDLGGAYADNTGSVSWAICTGADTTDPCPGFSCGEDGPAAYDISGVWWLSNFGGSAPVGYATVGSDGTYVVTGGDHDGETGVVKCCGNKIYFLNDECTNVIDPGFSFALSDSGNFIDIGIYGDYWCRTGHCPP